MRIPANILRTLIICAAFMMGCTPSTDKNKQQTAPSQPLQEETSHLGRSYIPPPEHGAFIKVTTEDGRPEFLQLTAGQQNRLMPTNAERGFGFNLPFGTHITSNHQHFAVRSDELHLNMLQITAFQGVAVGTKPWAAPITDENTAWLPLEAMPAQVKIIAKDDGLAEIILEKPLPPGFYILHDESLIRAEQPEDVRAFYPFVITDNPGDPTHWVAEADACFQEIFNQFGTQICRNRPSKRTQYAIKPCAMKQRLAAKAHGVKLLDLPLVKAVTPKAEKTPDSRDANLQTADIEGRNAQNKELKSKASKDKVKTQVSQKRPPVPGIEEYQARIAYLERLSDPDNPANYKIVMELAQTAQCKTAQELWKIAQHDQMLRLIKLHKMIEVNDLIAEESIKAVIDYYMPDIQAPSVSRPQENIQDSALDASGTKIPGSDADEPPKPTSQRNAQFLPFEALAWVPFVTLEADDPALYTFYEAILFSDDWSLNLVELLGAIHYRKLMDETQKSKSLSEWFKQMDVDVPEIFRIRAKTMSFRSQPAELTFGPYLFTAIAPNLTAPWRATFQTQYNAVRACFAQVKHQQPGVFILEQPLDGSILTQKVTGVLRDPIDTLRPWPALDPVAADCILKSFGSLPAMPALNPKQHIKMAISIGPKQPSP